MSFGISGSGLRRAGIGGLAALTCAGLVATGSPASALPASGGIIGVVDTQPGTPFVLDGATLVKPGQAGQALDDLHLRIPNDFKAGDAIRLALFDRSAAGNAPDGTVGMNLDAAHKLVFSGTQTVSVSAATGTGVAPPAGAVAPTITVAAAASESQKSSANRSHGTANHDELVLTIGNTTPSAAKGGFYDVNVSGIKVDTGAALTPGEIRVVPFTTGKGLLGSVTLTTTFGGNKDGAKPTIKAYTVPGYVAPVSLTAGTPASIKADGAPHPVGDLTVSELNSAALQAGTYTVTVAGATVANTATTPVTATLTGQGTGESIDGPVTVSGNTVSFKLKQTAQATDPGGHNGTKASIALHGLQLASAANGPINYTLTGGSVDQFLANAGSSPAVGPFAADSAFGPSAAAVPPTGTTATFSIPGPKITAAGSATGAAPGRLGGADRYATAAQVALRTAGTRTNGGSTVVLASGETFPDALSAGYLSQRLGGAPVLLTQANNLPVATRAALAQLHTTNVWIVGGTSAVSTAVANGVRTILDNNAGGQGMGSLGRLSGADRYATNEAVNEASWNHGTIGTTTLTFGQAAKKTALLATGEDFADALASGPAIAGTDAAIPLVLTKGNALSPSAQTQLTDFGITQVVIVGGEQAISPAVATALTGAGIAVTRIAGADRYETAAKMADFERAARTPASASVTGGLGFAGRELFLATGQNYADALAGGPLAANLHSSIVLTTSLSLSPTTGGWIAANKAGLGNVTALGGPSAVPDATLQAAANALG
jgi:putative cell wall-binding protein